MHTRRRYFLRTATVQNILDDHHLTHMRFAEHLGLSRSYWSQLFNRRRHLTPSVRQDLRASRYLRHLCRAELWDTVVEERAA